MAIGAEQRYYLKLKAAQYYYERNMNQAEIADMLQVSRLTLGRLLKEAREEGIVKIEIIDHRGMKHCIDAEASLCETFGLQDAKIIECAPGAAQGEINRQIGHAAARYFERLLHSNMRVAMGWGRTLEAMVNSLHPNKNITGLEVVTMLGGASMGASMIQPNILAQSLLNKYAGTAYILNAPYICRTHEMCEEIKKEPGVAEALRRAMNADITLIGVGERPEVSERYHAYYPYKRETIAMLLSQGATGDILAHFIDENGWLCNTEVCRRVISLHPEELKKHKRVVMAGGGETKISAIYGALSGGYAHVLITDYATAQAVLRRRRVSLGSPVV